MSSKFSSIFEARKVAPEPPAEVEVEPTSPPSPAPPKAEPKQASEKRPRSPSPAPQPQKRLGRPPGKRSDAEHVQVTAYIRRETHLAVKMALLASGDRQEFSELVQELLSKWVKSRS